MSSKDIDLRRLLTRLEKELRRVSDVDSDSRELLRRLQGEIQGILKTEPGALKQEDAGLRELLQEPGEILQSSRPELAGMIRNIINFLDNSGV